MPALKTQLPGTARLVALAIEYFRMFQFGLRSVTDVSVAHPLSSADRDVIRRQEAFVYSVVDPDVIVGSNMRGPHAQQWRLHTRALEGFWFKIASPPRVIGSDEDPIVKADLLGGFTMVPPFVDDFVRSPARSLASRLLKNSMNKSVALSCCASLQFSSENRIKWKIMQADYAQTFVNLGLALPQVAEVMKISRLTVHSTIEPLERW